jgi:hypothetical protein
VEAALDTLNAAYDAYGQHNEDFADEFRPLELSGFIDLDMPNTPDDFIEEEDE